jgi:hypothetical protein
VLQVDGRWRCTQCGALIKLPSDATPPQVVFKANSGEPIMRTLNVEGNEIHRCPAVDQPREHPSRQPATN